MEKLKLVSVQIIPPVKVEDAPQIVGRKPFTNKYWEELKTNAPDLPGK